MTSENFEHQPQDQISRQQMPESAGGVEYSTGIRNGEISNLFLDLVHKFNPKIDKRKLELDIFTDRNIFSESLDAQLDNKDNAKYLGIPDALRIAWYYYEHTDRRVPTRAIILGTHKDPESLIEPEEKVLVYVDPAPDRIGAEKLHVSVNKAFGQSDDIEFKGRRKIGRSEVKIESPDVFLAGIYEDAGRIRTLNPVLALAIAGERHNTYKESFSIRGCDNLLVGGDLTPQGIKSGDRITSFYLRRISLSCKGDLTMLSGTKILSPSRSPSVVAISLHAGGDVELQGDTAIQPAEVDCKGILTLVGNSSEVRPTNGRRPPIRCREIKYTDSTRPPLDDGDFDISGDVDEVDRILRREERTMSNKMGIPLDDEDSQDGDFKEPRQDSDAGVQEGNQAESLAPQDQVDVEEEFNTKYHPDTERVVGEGEERRILRGYNIPADNNFIKFQTEAEAAGWEIQTATQVGTIMAVSLIRSNKKQ